MFIKITSYICLALIAVLIFFYSMFGAHFSEINIQLPFLDFPIFVGELVMIFCLFVLFIHHLMGIIRWKRWHVWVLVYFAWVIFKAAEGYMNSGAYALRNAALFYYPVFVVFVAYFLGNLKVVHRIEWVILFSPVFLAVIAFVSVQAYLFVLALCVALGISHRWIRWVFIGFLIGFFLFQFPLLSSGRGCFIGIVVGIFFLVWYGAQLIRVPLWKQAALFFIIIGLFFMVLLIWGDRNAMTSLVNPSQIITMYRDNVKTVDEHKDAFATRQLKIKLYHNNSQYAMPAEKALLQKEVPSAAVVDSRQDSELGDKARYRKVGIVENNITHKGIPKTLVPQEEVAQSPVPQNQVTQTIASKLVTSKPQQYLKKPGRNLDVAYNNALFRLFIWRDMVRELIKYRPVFGFSYGRPQRSVSLEILGWGQEEWLRDGWITPHNSFLHLIYRGGIIGVIVIGFILFSIIIMTMDFLRARSWRGGLLISVLVYWIINAQFGLILDLPYNAIIFWTLFGITWVYRNKFIAASVKE